MDLMKCPSCGQALDYIVTETLECPATADGAFLIAAARLISPPKEDFDLVCERCGKVFCWSTDENGRMRLTT